jgi:hypothetical protein
MVPAGNYARAGASTFDQFAASVPEIVPLMKVDINGTMMYMRRYMLGVVVSCALMDESTAAQTQPQAQPQAQAQPPAATDVFEKAPPQIEEPLRANVAKFFQAHVDGKFRQAEDVIAEDSKDAFYNMEKRRYFGFEIIKIKYSDDYTKATVVTTLDMEWRSPRIGVMRVKPPLSSLWRLENDKWVWYVVESKDWDTPWGKMQPGPDQQKSIMSAFQGVNVSDVLKQVAIDRTEIRLRGYEASEGQAVIENNMPGQVRLRLDAPTYAGLEVTLDKTELAAGQTARVFTKFSPETTEPKPTTRVSIHVEPTGRVFYLDIVFDIQPEMRKLLPKELQK